MVSERRDEILLTLLEKGPQNKYNLYEKQRIPVSSVYEQIKKLLELRYIEVFETKPSQRSKRIKTTIYKLTFYGLHYLIKIGKVETDIAGDRRRYAGIKFPMDFGEDKTNVILKGQYEENLPKMLELIDRYDSRNFYQYLIEIDLTKHFLPTIVHFYFAFIYALVRMSERDKKLYERFKEATLRLRNTDREFNQFIDKNILLIKL